MNVLMCANEFAFYGTEVVLYSLLKYNKNVNITIFTGTIDIDTHDGVIYNHRALNEVQQNELHKVVNYFDSNSTLKIVDVVNLFNTELGGGGKNRYTGFTPHSMLRLLSDVYYDPAVSDLMYLDSDLIITENIEDEYNKYTHIDSPYSAFYAPDAVGYEGEMNSGVIFFNMRKCREIDFFKRARINLINNAYKYPDQMAMKDVCAAHPIPSTLNYFYNLIDIHETPKIIHFTNELKCKPYNEKGEMYFHKLYPQFDYIKDGIKIIREVNIKA